MDRPQLSPFSECSSGSEDEEYQHQFTVEEICSALNADPANLIRLQTPTEENPPVYDFVPPENIIIEEVGFDWELEGTTCPIPIIDTTSCGNESPRNSSENLSANVYLLPEESHTSDNDITVAHFVDAGTPVVTVSTDDFGCCVHEAATPVPSKTTAITEDFDNNLEPEDLTVPPSLNHLKISKAASKQQSKLNRVLGQPYIGFRRKDKGSTKTVLHDIDREGRKMGPPCTSPNCRRWTNRSCPVVPQSDRELIFNDFWKTMTSWAEKRTYVCSTVSIQPTKQKTVRGKPSRRASTYFYQLKIQDRRYPVCREMYLNTLGLKRAELHYWLSNFQQHNVPRRRGHNCPSDQEDDLPLQPIPQRAENNSKIEFSEAIGYLNRFLDELPTLPSHYCRKNSSKLYLQTDIRSWSQLYEMYRARCLEDSAKVVSKFSFRRVRKQKNIDIHQPKKDRCDVCCSFELGHISQDIYDAHILNKESARQEKEIDKSKAKEESSLQVLCFDLMMVQPLPRLRAASAYYKLKLTSHCFTVYNMNTHDCMAYWFDETQATLNATTFASCLFDYIEELIDESTKTIILYSDGCCYQNRNAILSNALLHLTILKNVTIIQKFLEKGHTQMECDSAHSTIERRIEKVDVHLTSQYVGLTREARKTPFPYRSKMIDHRFIKDFSHNLIYPSIRPGRKSGDPTVTNLRWLQYEPSGKIKYKLAFQDELRELPCRPKTVKPVSTFPFAYSTRPSVPMDKYADLQTLKSLMPSDTHEWYDAIPHEDESRRKLKRKSETPQD